MYQTENWNALNTLPSYLLPPKIKYQTEIRYVRMSYSGCDQKKGIKKHKHKHTYSATRTYNRQQKIQLIRCHLTCMTVISHSTWKILYTKNKCAQHAYTPAYVGVKQIEKLESLDSHTTMIIVQCAWFRRREVRFQYKMSVFCSFFLEIHRLRMIASNFGYFFFNSEKKYFFRNNSCLK